MPEVYSISPNKVIHVHTYLVVPRPSAIQVRYLTKAILRPASVICIEFDIPRKFDCSRASFRDVELRVDLEVSKKNHVLVSMEGENSCTSLQGMMGLDSRHQVSIEIDLCILIVSLN